MLPPGGSFINIFEWLFCANDKIAAFCWLPNAKKASKIFCTQSSNIFCNLLMTCDFRHSLFAKNADEMDPWWQKLADDLAKVALIAY